MMGASKQGASPAGEYIRKVRVLAQIEANSGSTFTFELSPAEIPGVHAYAEACLSGMAAKRIARCPKEMP